MCRRRLTLLLKDFLQVVHSKVGILSWIRATWLSKISFVEKVFGQTSHLCPSMVRNFHSHYETLQPSGWHVGSKNWKTLVRDPVHTRFKRKQGYSLSFPKSEDFQSKTLITIELFAGNQFSWIESSHHTVMAGRTQVSPVVDIMASMLIICVTLSLIQLISF